MDSVLRALTVYAFVWAVFRIAGKRSLAQITTFDFVLLLIISETTQEALIDNDHSMTNAFLLIATFFVVDIALSLIKHRLPATEAILDGTPLLIYANGKPIRRALMKERTSEDVIRAAARETRGLVGLDQVEYAILECDGEISVIPKEKAETTGVLAS